MVHGAGCEVYTNKALVIVEYIQELLHLLNVKSEWSLYIPLQYIQLYVLVYLDVYEYAGAHTAI